MSKRKHYDNEFKVQAVKLALEIGQSKACNELNLPENTIYGWMHAYRHGKLDLGPGTQTPARALTMNEELIELRKQVEEQAKESKRPIIPRIHNRHVGWHITHRLLSLL